MQPQAIAPCSTERAPARLYFPALDGLRAMAFLMVFGQHYLHLPWGWSGVDIFFVLSGFLITGVLYDSRERPHRVRDFYIRRTLRIFPLYYGVLLLLLLTYPILRWDWSWKWLLWPAYLGNFCHGLHPMSIPAPLQKLSDFLPQSRSFSSVQLYLGHFWSLCVEEQFYLFWPWVVFRVRDRKKLMSICLFFCVACPLMRAIGSHTIPQYILDRGALYRWTPFRIDALLLGGWVSLVLRGAAADRLRKAVRVVGGTLFVAMIAFVACHSYAEILHPKWQYTWGLTLVDLVAACLIVMALEPGSTIYRVFSLRPLRWIGRISYGAYIFHEMLHPIYINIVVHYIANRAILVAVVGLPMTLLLAWASFRWYETPFIRLKERWTRGSPDVQPTL